MSYVLLCSGGMDSVTLMHEYFKEITHVLSFNYGSKHNQVELEYAGRNCDLLGIKHVIVDLPFVNELFKSDLLQSGGDIPEGHYADESMKRTVVPFRNGIMLAIACGFAESVGSDAVLIANHAGDHAIYPDCRLDFVASMSHAMQSGTYAKVKITAPYTEIDKRAIALRGQQLGIDYSVTYSCYKGGEVHCGVCGTCTERKEALEGFDPTVYLK